jgi:hypothetical protein
MLILGTACSGVQTIPDTAMAPKALVEYDPPKWVLMGGGAWTDKEGKAFYGIGSATGIQNFSLQRTIADDRARGDLAKVFEVYVNSLTKDYQAHTTMGGFDTSSEEQNSEVAMKVVVKQTLRGAVIVDHFEIPERNEFLALARLEYDAVKRNISTSQEFKKLPDNVREGIKKRAANRFKLMEEESNKFYEEEHGHSFDFKE